MEHFPRFNLGDAFATCDLNASGFITTDELHHLFERHGIRAPLRDVAGLVDRFDSDRDGRVSYSEFAQEVRPKSPARKF